MQEEDPDSGMRVFKEVSRNFCKNLHDYQTKFQAWKRRDEVVLMTRIKGALHGLMISMFILAAQSPFDVDIIHQGTDPLLVEIKIQIQRLRQKTIQIAGHEKIAEFDLAMASEMRKYRMLRLMREEMRRNGGTGAFDFIKS